MRQTLLLTVVFLSGCPQLPPPSGCEPRTSECRNDRPYVCSGTQRWTAVGDATCTAVGAVCCRAPDGVHACVMPTDCVEE